jgi:hypothetical protein
MRNDVKIVLAILVVLLIILVGAFALSGSKGPQATVTPTAQPTNALTPTPTPIASGTGGSSGGASNPTPTPTITPTAAPTVAPSPTPSSGVEQTQFGYWITYPPLKPENWSTNPPPQVNQGIPNNTVYFSPTSASQDIGYVMVESYGYYVNATIYRNGDLNSSTTANVHVDTSDNVWEDSIGSWYDLFLNGNFSDFLDVPDFSVTFAPGVSSMNITIADEGLDNWDSDDSVQAIDTSYFGYIKMTITGVDDGYTYGYNSQYTLTLNAPSVTPTPTATPSQLSTVQFASPSGTFITGPINDTGAPYYFNITMVRTTEDLSYHQISITGYGGPGDNWSQSYLDFYGPTFNAGSSTTNLTVYATGGTGLPPKTVTMSIDDWPGQYNVGTNQVYTLTVEYPPAIG